MTQPKTATRVIPNHTSLKAISYHYDHHLSCKSLGSLISGYFVQTGGAFLNHETFQIGREVNELWVLVHPKRSAADFESPQSPGLVTSKVSRFVWGIVLHTKISTNILGFAPGISSTATNAIIMKPLDLIFWGNSWFSRLYGTKKSKNLSKKVTKHS